MGINEVLKIKISPGIKFLDNTRLMIPSNLIYLSSLITYLSSLIKISPGIKSSLIKSN